MNLASVIHALDGETLVPGEAYEEEPVGHVVASDLMSDVLTVNEDRVVLLTALASDQALRTAQMIGALGVIVVNNKHLPSSMRRIAAETGLTLARTPLPQFEACCRLGAVLSPGGREPR
ncbi:MAG: hypothetical protein K9N49_01320 [Candidatus Marinimicrobia bacterium]|nr:hypothetical protein [Candidatus Neomarinimicrobiota bacterium]